METKYKDLVSRLIAVDDVNSAAAILSWDQTTYMPPGGASARGRQIATLGKLAHEQFTSPEIGRLLDDLLPYEESLPYDSDEASLLRVARRQYDRAVRVPAEFMERLYTHMAESYEAWGKARPENDFPAVQPYLEKTLDLSRELANFFPGYEHIADPLISYSDYGMTAATVGAIFSDLRDGLVPLANAIFEQPPADDSALKRTYPKNQQLAFGEGVIRAFGFDFERGRQDMTLHPYMTKFSLGDVRITTRVNENDLNEALFGTLHESGHAMYEQGIRMAYEGTPLADGTSSGVHESQSRLWENLVGRSLPFWKHYYPELQAEFPDQLADVSLDAFYQAINKVERSLIRTSADEVTYNLHVIIRFDLELAMLEGGLDIADLPEAWHARYESDLGTRAPSDINGVLQDVHWYAGTIGGAFQGYTLGNIMSAVFFDAAVAAHPSIPSEIEQGRFDTLHAWLRENIYQHGTKYTASELVERISGGPLNIEPYMRYLNTKFGELYNLN
ncbi:MAG: carboxypeptidase M32 [Anaerolineales bacterium]|nr:carboxypeptidase M32 [Anaerolineales bacterium]